MKKLITIMMSALFVFSGTLLAGDCHKAEKDHRKEGGQGKSKFSRGHHARGRMARMIARYLNLSEEQKAKAKELRESNSEKMKKFAEVMREAQKALREASNEDDLNENAIRDLARNAADARAEMMIIQAKMKKEFQEILTDEQKTKLENKKAEMKKRMEKMRERFNKSEGNKKAKRGCRGCDRKKGCDK